MNVQAKVKLIRVLIVEDSPSCRDLLVTILQNSPDFQVVGTARNGLEAVRLAKRLAPDIVIMDVHMPEMDGLEATRQIMREAPCPVVMINAGLDQAEPELSSNALKAGALSLLEKPTAGEPVECRYRLLHQLRLMAEIRVVRRWYEGTTVPTNSNKVDSLPAQPVYPRNSQVKIRLVTIAASTGGPGILAGILGRLPANFPVPILIVQHITAGFGGELANWLNQQTSLKVRLAHHGDEPQPGQVLLAPDNAQMSVNVKGLIALNQQTTPQGICPSADHLFHSVAQVYGPAAIGVLLTGMGSDGAEGLRMLRQNGARTIAQDRESSIVFGMPAVAIELGAAEQILPANRVALALLALLGLNETGQ